LRRNFVLKHINTISRIEEDNFVWLDKFTIRNLELYQSNSENGKSLIDVIDKTVSPMGSRLLKRWIALPLKNRDAINERLTAVEYFIQTTDKRYELISLIKEVGDLERLISKVAAFKVSPRELAHLKKSLLIISEIKEFTKKTDNSPLEKISDLLNPCLIMYERLQNELHEDAPVNVLKGKVLMMS
jgi:DNA mismatch repair protein MutS